MMRLLLFVRSLISAGIFISILVLMSDWSGTWLGELACSFRAYYSPLLAAIAILLLFKKRWLFAALFTLAAAANVISLMPMYRNSSVINKEKALSITVVQVNVQRENLQFMRLVEYIKETKPDLIAVEECTPACDEAIRANLSEYADRFTRPANTYYGVGVYSKLKIVSGEAFVPHVAGPDEPSVICTVEKNGRPLRVAAVHVYAPYLPEQQKMRDEQFHQIAEHLQSSKAPPTILLGDLNTTPWSDPFKHFLKELMLKDSQIGYGVRPTCGLLNLNLLWVPIDFCLVPPNAKITSHEVGPQFGSDHCPICVEIEL